MYLHVVGFFRIFKSCYYMYRRKLSKVKHFDNSVNTGGAAWTLFAQ